MVFYWGRAFSLEPIHVCLTGRVAGNMRGYERSLTNTVHLVFDKNPHLKSRVRIKKYFYDYSPLAPMRAYRKMVSAHCSAIIGYEYLSDLLLAIENQNKLDIPILTSYASSITGEVLPKNIFMFMPTYDFQSSKMLEFLLKKFGELKKVLIITEINRDEMMKYKASYSKDLKKHRIEFSTFDFLEYDTSFLNKLEQHIKDEKYSFVFLLSGGIAATKIANRMNNHANVFIGTENFGSSVSPTFFIRLINHEINSYFIRNFDYIKPNEEVHHFYQDYLKTFNEKPTVSCAYTFDALNMIFESIKTFNKVDTESLYKITYQGITGARIAHGDFYRSKDYVILSLNPQGYVYEH